MDNMWDCIIVGGGAAGLSAALAAGVFAAGDLSVQMPQVAAAIASGSQAAAAVVQSLMADEYGLAVPEGRQRVNA